MRPVGTAIAGTGSAVTSGAVEGRILRAVQGTLTLKRTFAVIIAFERHLAFMSKGPVEFDFFAHRGFVFSNGLCNGGFGGAVDDSGKDNTSFI